MRSFVAERVPHTYQSFCEAVVSEDPDADAASVKMFLGVVAGFFCLVVEAAGDLGFQLKDLHWKNLGLTNEGAVLFIDLEGFSHKPDLKPRRGGVV